GAEAVRAVAAYTGAFPGSIEAGKHRPVSVYHDFGVHVGRNAAHRVMRRGLDRHRLFHRINAEIGAAEVKNIGQLLLNIVAINAASFTGFSQITVDGFGANVEIDVVLALNTVAVANL